MAPEKADKKAEALLKAGDALGAEFPAKSRELLRLCRVWREKAKQLRAKDEATRP